MLLPGGIDEMNLTDGESKDGIEQQWPGLGFRVQGSDNSSNNSGDNSSDTSSSCINARFIGSEVGNKGMQSLYNPIYSIFPHSLNPRP